MCGKFQFVTTPDSNRERPENEPDQSGSYILEILCNNHKKIIINNIFNIFICIKVENASIEMAADDKSADDKKAAEDAAK